MIGTASVQTAEAASASELSRLAESFRTFNLVTRDLESAYAGLKARAERIDARLGETNAELSAKVAALAAAEARLTATLEVVPTGVVVADRDGSLVALNAAGERVLGRSAAELLGRRADGLRGKDGAPLLLLGDETIAVPSTIERTVAAFDGARRRIRSRTSALPDGGRLEILEDLTEVAHLRAQLNRLDTLAALGEMAAGIAHEVRNPLNGVEGFAGLMARALECAGPPDRAQLFRYVDRIRRGVAEVDEIIANLLLWAKPDRLVRTSFCATALFEELCDEAVRLAPAALTARLETDGVDDGRPIVADRVKLKVVLANLLKNAFEAGGPNGLVRVLWRRDGSGLTATVSDDGPGVRPEMRKRLFRPFSTDKAAGTGLGLAVARKLVECHGGELKHVEDPAPGATFTMTVPDAPIENGDAS